MNKKLKLIYTFEKVESILKKIFFIFSRLRCIKNFFKITKKKKKILSAEKHNQNGILSKKKKTFNIGECSTKLFEVNKI